jgi:hypothetical protein
MIRIALAGAAALALLVACNDAPETPAASTEPAGVHAVDPAETAAAYMEAIRQFNPATQHFVWVLPEGVHGVGPWDIDVTVRHRGEVKHEATIPLKAEIVPAASRPEFPAGSEVVRLSDDGLYEARMVDVQKVIDGLIAQFGRGDGELLMESELRTTIDTQHRNAYCVEGRKPEVRFFREEGDRLTAVSLGPLAPMFEASILKDCAT